MFSGFYSPNFRSSEQLKKKKIPPNKKISAKFKIKKNKHPERGHHFFSPPIIKQNKKKKKISARKKSTSKQ
jgi:hypothetical protein